MEKLRTLVEDIKCAWLFGSKPPHNDSLWNAAKIANFEVQTSERNIINKEKGVDTNIVQKIAEYLYCESKKDDVFILVMGDGDFVPSARAIKNKNLFVRLAFWDNVSGELLSEVDEFYDLSSNIDLITASLPIKK